MWKVLYQLASPKSFYDWSGRWIFAMNSISYILLIVGLAWGLLFAPADYQQGDAFRIMYVHVPAALMSMALYAWMGFLSVLLLVWRIKLAGLVLGATAQIGACMALLALISGSIWGKPMWGTWWVWDARLTSELILFFLYVAILATRNAYPDKEQSDKVIAILTLVGLIDLPIIHYSVYWWNTLHQGSTLTLFAKPKIHPSMLYPLLLVCIGQWMYCSGLILVRTRNSLLWRERRQIWVKQLAEVE